MVKDKMVKDKVVKVEVVENEAEKREWIRDAVFLLLGAVITAIAGCIVICYNDYRIDNRTREDLKKIISYDVQTTTSDLNNFLETYSRAEMIEKSNNPKLALNIIDYDTSVFDAYIHKISLLPKVPAKRILIFYKNLRVINGAKYIFQNKDSNMSSKGREKWAIIIYEAFAKAAELGKDIIKDCSGQYTKDPDDSYWPKVSAASSVWE